MPCNVPGYACRNQARRCDRNRVHQARAAGSSFDIIGWKRVPKPKASETIESDVAPKAGSAQQGGARPGQSADERTQEEEQNELWYKVRLSAAASPAPAGWIYGKQVELAVPSDIIFYLTGR